MSELTPLDRPRETICLVSDESLGLLGQRGVSPVLSTYFSALTEFCSPVHNEHKDKLARLAARLPGTQTLGDDWDRTRTAVLRASELVRPMSAMLRAFLERFPAGRRDGPRLLVQARHSITPLTDGVIVSYAWQLITEFIGIEPSEIWLLKLSGSPSQACLAIASDIRTASGRYKPLRRMPEVQGAAATASALLVSIAHICLVAEGGPCRHVITALKTVTGLDPGIPAGAREHSIAILHEMLDGSFHRNEVVRPPDADEWEDAGFSLKQARPWRIATFSVTEAKDFKDADVDCSKALRWRESFPDVSVRAQWLRTRLDWRTAAECKKADVSPEEFNGVRVNLSEPKDWRKIFPDVRVRAQWMKTGLGVQLARECLDLGMSPAQARRTAALIEALYKQWKKAGHRVEGLEWAAAGYSVEDAAPWFAVEPLLTEVTRYTEAKPWMDLGLSPADVARWNSTGAGRDAVEWAALGFSPEQTEALISAGMFALEAKQWVQGGVAPEAVAEWLAAGFSPYFAIGQAEAWIRAGFAIEDAKRWLDAGFQTVDAHNAEAWRDAGFSPEQAGRWLDAGSGPYAVWTPEIQRLLAEGGATPDEPPKR